MRSIDQGVLQAAWLGAMLLDASDLDRDDGQAGIFAKVSEMEHSF